MSKAKLKKELSTFSDEQLVDLILNAYDSSKEAKAYFEFFLNPDIDGLMEKKMAAIEKEARRSKWGCSKARISRIKAEIKSVEDFGVGAEYGSRLRFFAIRELVFVEKYLDYTNAFIASIDKMIVEYLEYMAKNGLLLKALEEFDSYIFDVPDSGTERYRKHIRAVVDTGVRELRTKLGLTI